MKFQEFQMAGNMTQNYANILELLLRLRQACDHPILTLNAIRAKQQKTIALAAERAARTLKAAPAPEVLGQSTSRDPFADIEELVARFMASEGGSSAAFVEKVKQDLQAFVAARESNGWKKKTVDDGSVHNGLAFRYRGPGQHHSRRRSA